MSNSTPEPIALVTRRTILWNDFKRLSKIAQDTLDLEDGLAAGRAYRAFMDDFLAPNQSGKLAAIKHPNRRAGV